MLIKPGTRVRLKQIAPDDKGPFKNAEDAIKETKLLCAELNKLQYLLYAEQRRALLVILQGMDTSGKDGAIRKVLGDLSPLGVQVKAFKAPHEEELAHDFLWRVHQAVPRKGYLGIFNRSHYEDVLVVRVHNLVSRQTWKDRYAQINQFEKILVKNGVIILKFFLHISKGEQKQRLHDRLHDPTRYWKFSLGDLEERRYWKHYRKAYEEALSRCGTAWAPWHVVPADHKWHRDYVVAKTMVETLRGLDMKFPPPTVDLAKVVID